MQKQEYPVVYCPLCLEEVQIIPTIDDISQPTLQIVHGCAAINVNFRLRYVNKPQLIVKPIQYFATNLRFSFELSDLSLSEKIHDYLLENYKKNKLLKSDFYDNFDRTNPVGQEYVGIQENILTLLFVTKFGFKVSYFLFKD